VANPLGVGALTFAFPDLEEARKPFLVTRSRGVPRCNKWSGIGNAADLGAPWPDRRF